MNIIVVVIVLIDIQCSCEEKNANKRFFRLIYNKTPSNKMPGGKLLFASSYNRLKEEELKSEEDALNLYIDLMKQLGHM